MAAPVTVTLGGVARELRYDLNALAALRAKHGLNLLALPEGQDYEDPVLLRALLWAGLLHADRTLDIDVVGGWVGLDTLAVVGSAVGEALQAAMTPEVSADRSGP